jgi:hypothetical protein
LLFFFFFYDSPTGVTSRVTRLGDYLFRQFYEKYTKSYVLLNKKWSGLHFGRFLTNSSGHPGYQYGKVRPQFVGPSPLNAELRKDTYWLFMCIFSASIVNGPL